MEVRVFSTAPRKAALAGYVSRGGAAALRDKSAATWRHQRGSHEMENGFFACAEGKTFFRMCVSYFCIFGT